LEWYSFQGAGQDVEPEIQIVENIDSFEITRSKIRERLGYESITISHSCLSMVLTSHRSNEGPLMAFVYNNIEKYIENIVGKL
jgi:hypothetical protein